MDTAILKTMPLLHASRPTSATKNVHFRPSVGVLILLLCTCWFCDGVAEPIDTGGPYADTVTGPIKKLPNGGRPPHKVPFPAISDWATLKISLSRSACFGTCPGYSVEIRGDGSVFYQGGDYVAVSGNHRSSVSMDEVRSLFDAFGKSDFFWTFDEYRADITDNPTYVVAISYDGHRKRVVDYVGRAVGMPREIAELENTIDAIAHTEKWVRGNANTFPSLEAEHWDFRVPDDEHQRLIESAVGGETPDLVRELLTAGTSAKTKFGCRALERAANAANAEIVNILLVAGAPVHRDASKEQKYDYDCDALSAAASEGVPRIVQAILDRHPDVNWQNNSGGTALMLAARGDLATPRRTDRDFPAVVKMLISAGADVNLRDADGASAIMKVEGSGEIVKLLLAAGAKDINKTDWRGQTILFEVFDAQVAEALLEGGADPWLRDTDGKNAYEFASAMYGDNYDAGPVLKRWMEAHPEASYPKQ